MVRMSLIGWTLEDFDRDGRAYDHDVSSLPPPDPTRQAAIDRIKAKQAFYAALAAYLIVNVFLWILWAVTDDDKSGLPWPFWITLFWGVGMAFSAYNIFVRRPISESAIEREMRRGTQ